MSIWTGEPYYDRKGRQMDLMEWARLVEDREYSVVAQHYPPHAPKRPGGQFIDALLAVAYATGTADYGLPGPHTAGAN